MTSGIPCFGGGITNVYFDEDEQDEKYSSGKKDEEDHRRSEVPLVWRDILTEDSSSFGSEESAPLVRRARSSSTSEPARIEEAAVEAARRAREAWSSRPSSANAAAGDDLEADFTRHCVIGRGAFGKVFLTEKLSGKDANRLYAMKVLRLKKKATTTMERKLLWAVDHPYVVKLVYAFHSEKRMFLVMEYAPRGTLADVLGPEGRLSAHQARIVAAEIVSAVVCLHAHGIVHRDVKPSNVLVDSAGHVLLSDFGLAAVCDSGQLRLFCGSIEYLAPEVLRGHNYGKPVDYWAFGCLVFKLLVGRTPFQATRVRALFCRILKSDPKWPARKASIGPAMDFVRGLLSKDPEARLGARNPEHEIFSADFFRDFVDWRLLNRRKAPAPFSCLETGASGATGARSTRDAAKAAFAEFSLACEAASLPTVDQEPSKNSLTTPDSVCDITVYSAATQDSVQSSTNRATLHDSLLDGAEHDEGSVTRHPEAPDDDDDGWADWFQEAQLVHNSPGKSKLVPRAIQTKS
ncbi:hypothetical protein CTAYLR_009667 [Chrysophaeum taylorii]|uniref:Protein kinase domain-containing protein n=1 Tax=Chrysophaeum taylorii TaxID=2483200 RepID=A0AAD7XPF8_9STRA|nr:hypothetical protein CTAYLR_009667 [Chrysophaeum taylorii]